MFRERELNEDSVHGGIVVEVFNGSKKLMARQYLEQTNGLRATSTWVTDSGKIW